MKQIRKLYFKIFKHYRVVERRVFTYKEADQILRETCGLPEPYMWSIDAEYEDNNRAFGIVFLCRKERIKF